MKNRIFISTLLFILLVSNGLLAQKRHFYVGGGLGLGSNKYSKNDSINASKGGFAYNASVIAPLSTSFALELAFGQSFAKYEPNTSGKSSEATPNVPNKLVNSRVTFMQAKLNGMFFLGTGEVLKPYFLLGAEYNMLQKARYTFSTVADSSLLFDKALPMGALGVGCLFANGAPIAYNFNFGFRAGPGPKYIKPINQIFVNVGVYFKVYSTKTAAVRRNCPTY